MNNSSVKEFFSKLKELVNKTLNDNSSRIKREDLEENGKIYFMNDRDNTTLDCSMNNHLPPFMCFYDVSNLEAIQIVVNFDGNISIYLYEEGDSKPFKSVLERINPDLLYEVSLFLYVSFDKKKLYRKQIDNINYDINISDEDKKLFNDSCGLLYINNTIVKKYVESLRNKYFESGKGKVWNEFIETKKQCTNSELLKKEFPKVSKSLISLLEYCDGSSIYFLGSDVDNGRYPYYLLSSDEMLKSKDNIKKYYGDFIDRKLEEVEVDNRIANDSSNVLWVHFADCMNNGGTSQLFIDLTPSSSGRKGQIIRYLHDPDSLEVIANSFDEYLNRQVKNGLKFISNQENYSYTKPKTEEKPKDKKISKKELKKKLKEEKKNKEQLIIKEAKIEKTEAEITNEINEELPFIDEAIDQNKKEIHNKEVQEPKKIEEEIIEAPVAEEKETSEKVNVDESTIEETETSEIINVDESTNEKETVEVKEEKTKEIKVDNSKKPNIKLKVICICLIIVSLINIIMMLAKPFSNIVTTIVLFIALASILSVFIYSYIRLLKNKFNNETFNIVLIMNILFSLQYINEFNTLNIILIVINLLLSVYGMSLIEKSDE